MGKSKKKEEKMTKLLEAQMDDAWNKRVEAGEAGEEPVWWLSDLY